MDMKDCSVDAIKNAVKSLDNFLWSIANNVVCTICHELFTEAATNECGHSYCLKCIKKFHATSKNGRVSCPLCRHSIKRRSQTANPILSKIAEIFSEVPEAFKDDVKRLTKNFENVGEDLVKSSRVSSMREEKVKEDVTKKRRGRRKGRAEQIASNDSIILCSVSSNNEELKSVSQVESKSELFVKGSPDVEKKLKNVKKVESKEKVSDWLKKVDSNVASIPPSDNVDGEYKSFQEPNDSKVNESGLSMIRVDYVKSKKPDDLCTDVTLTVGKDDDPYEFIASQRNTPPKKKRASRGRKKAIPQFEAIQSFDKSKVKKPQGEDTSKVFDDDGSSVGNVQKPIRTYSSRYRNQTVDVIRKEDTGSEGPVAVTLICSGDSVVIEDESDIVVSKPRSRRRILSSSSEDNSDSNVPKKPKLDTSDCEKIGKFGGSSKCFESPGWSRVSNLKMDFETANKRKPCRKSLNISGGELNVNTSRMKNTSDISVECDKPIPIPSDQDVYIEDLSQSSDVVVGFDSQQSTKNDFKAVVENMEKELEGIEKLQEKVHGGTEAEKPKSEVTRRTPNRKTIPFSLMGKIKKKKRTSIIFVKMGRLSPYMRKSDKTVVKLVFTSKSSKKISVGLQTEEECDKTIEAKISIGVQTLSSTSCAKEVQTIQSIIQKDATIQTEASVPSQKFQEFDTLKNIPNSVKPDVEVEFDTELQDELNKTWAATQGVKTDKKESNFADNELMQNVLNNIDLDLTRARECRTSGKQQAENGEESDSDIFIEQTPPKKSSGDCRTEEGVAAQNTEESFLILSGCDNLADTIKAKCERVENDENNQNELNWKSGEKSRKICIASSGIRNRKLLQMFVDKFKVEHLNSLTKDVTHLVVGLHENEDDELVPYCTPKFLFAMANKKWIVTESWLAESLKSNRIIAEDKFESVDPVGGNACNVARLSTGLLLENFEIYLFGKFVGITKEEFAELIRDCGGTIIPHLTGFSYRKKIRMILVDGTDFVGKNEFDSLSTKYRTLVMSRDVAIVSIQGYRMVNFTPFVQHAFSTEECVKWGYPLELVRKDDIDSDVESQF